MRTVLCVGTDSLFSISFDPIQSNPIRYNAMQATSVSPYMPSATMVNSEMGTAVAGGGGGDGGSSSDSGTVPFADHKLHAMFDEIDKRIKPGLHFTLILSSLSLSLIPSSHSFISNPIQSNVCVLCFSFIHSNPIQSNSVSVCCVIYSFIHSFKFNPIQSNLCVLCFHSFVH